MDSVETLIPELCRNSLTYYIKYIRPDYQFNWHHDVIIQKLEEVANGQNKRVIITLPPRHGKSEIVSRLFPSWYLGRNPNKEIIQVGYSDGFVSEFGRHVRNTIKFDEKFSHIFPNIYVADDSKAISKFKFKRPHRGSYFAVGVGGPCTGRGCDIAIIDDPIKNSEEAQSDLIRENMWTWYETTLRTRLMPGGSIIVVMTRWHADDLVGRLLQTDTNNVWEVINFPAINDNGEALWPEWYDEKYLLDIKLNSSPHTWSALYQQDPIIDGGNIIKQAWFKYYSPENLPEIKFKIWSVDTASKTGTENDYSVAQLWGEAANGYYLLKQMRGKWEYPELKRRLVTWFHEDPADLILVEDASSGMHLVQELKTTSLPVKGITPGKDMPRHKDERLQLASPLFETGRVFFPEKTDWVFDLQRELVGFPFMKNDDQVDTTTQALYRLSRKKRRSVGDIIPIPISAGESLKYLK